MMSKVIVQKINAARLLVPVLFVAHCGLPMVSLRN
jgi:hypothetical protein